MTRKSYFIRCLGGNLPADQVTAVKAGIPHRLNHPASQDRDVYTSRVKACAALSHVVRAFAGSKYTFVVTAVTNPAPLKP